MARVFTQKAAKDYPEKGIAKGDLYYSWTLHGGRRQISKTRPRPSQLTGSAKLSQAYAAREALEDDIGAATAETVEDIATALRTAAEEAQAVAEEYEDSLSNMPDALQQSSSGEAIQEKIDALTEWAQELEDAATEVEALDLDDYKESEDPAEALLEDAQSRASDACDSLSI